MIRSIRRSIKLSRVEQLEHSLYKRYKAAQARRNKQPLSYRQWREAMRKNSLTT